MFKVYINFKCYYRRLSASLSTIWKELNSNYDMYHDLLLKSLNDGEKETFNKFMHEVWKKVALELGIVYKLGLSDGK